MLRSLVDFLLGWGVDELLVVIYEGWWVIFLFSSLFSFVLLGSSICIFPIYCGLPLGVSFWLMYLAFTHSKKKKKATRSSQCFGIHCGELVIKVLKPW